MMSQRFLQQTARRLAVQQPASTFVASKFAAPSALLLQRRYEGTVASPKATSIGGSDNMQILANQRLHRPVSPHIAIYKPQLTWTLSILNRITGSILSGGFYIFGALYLAAPLLGWQITTAAMVAGVAKWPLILKVGTKALLAWPFMFHSFNGIRHLLWDMGMQMKNQQVISTGWVTLGISTIATVAVLFM